ncbi:phosphatidylinositol-4- kinase [Coemansia sp. Benny D115]|nr:phosphatidylinositol-4- kinase [Coemansia sp. Benny D115]
MECADLHSLILEELSQVLAIAHSTAANLDTQTTTDANEFPTDTDPAVQKILAQCPPLANTTRSPSKRQLNAVLALAKFVSLSAPDSTVRRVLLARVLQHLEAQMQTADETARWFMEQLTSRLLECASEATEDEATLITVRVWAQVHSLADALGRSTGSPRPTAPSAALLGMLAALENTPYCFGSADVLHADVLARNAGSCGGSVLRVLGAVLQARLDGRLQETNTSIIDSERRVSWSALAMISETQLDEAGSQERQAYEGIQTLALRAFDAAVAASDDSEAARCLQTAALASILLERLSPRLLDSALAHLRSPLAFELEALTQAAFRVLGGLAAFFSNARTAAVSAVMAFVTAPPQCLVDGLPVDGRASPEEQRLLQPAALTLAAALQPQSGGAVSSAHTLFGALVTAGTGQRGQRVARNVALTLAQLAHGQADPALAALVVGMLCAPRFATPALLPLSLQCAAAVAPTAGHDVVGDVVAAALKHVAFGSGADAAITAAAARTLAGLAAAVAKQRDAAERFLAMALRAFVDASVELPMPSRYHRRAQTPLSVFLPVLQALLPRDAPNDVGEECAGLWRDFWFHVVARGYLAEPSHVRAYGKAFAALAARAPVLVPASSVNYLETELAFSSVLQRDSSDSGLARLRAALIPVLQASPAAQTLVRSLGFAQCAFLLAVHSVESARATAAGGSCTAMLGYFGNAAVATSALLPAIEAIADGVVTAYVTETTTRRWAIDSQPVGSSHDTSAASRVGTQVRALMEAACHHLELVSRWAQRFADRILKAFPQALLDKSALCTLLELMQLVWKGCRAAQEDQFAPEYWFTSRTLGITLQLPDSVSYRKTLFGQVAGCARRWLELAGRAAPMELETLLQAYLATPSDDDLNYEPHVGRALAIDIGNAIRYGMPFADALPGAAAAPNSSSFAYRLSQRDYLRGLIGHGTDVAALKETLAGIYAAACESNEAATPDIRQVADYLQHATHCVVAASVIDRELVRLLVWVPLTLFDERLMRAAAHMWTTLIVERPLVEVLLMVELTVAWSWLIQEHRGLFAQRFEPRNPFAARMSYAPSDKSARARAHATISRALAPHTLLIDFLTQRFDSVKHLPDTNFDVINATLRILQVTFDSSHRITTNALARGPLFMLVHLGFKLLNLGFETSPILESSLREGLYRLAFRWFALPPRWSFSGSKASLGREIRVLIDTRRAVRGDSPLSLSKAHSDSQAGGSKLPAVSDSVSLEQGTVSTEKTASTSSLAEENLSDPVIPGSVSREQLRQRALSNRSLLLLLLENEICRMATWANPAGQPLAQSFPDVSKFARNTDMTETGWQNLVVDAWVADPSLAIQLTQRFSHPVVKRELTALICRFPGELVKDPDALPLLIEQLRLCPTPTSPLGTSTSHSSILHGQYVPSVPSLTFREQKFLLYWAPVPPITSTTYLASAQFSRNPLALQYAVRALQSFPVDLTFFYIPQLVQALRHDVSGHVEQAIVSSAQISQHFAHQIIWNMNANMFKDEDSQIPDTLKPTLDRIVKRILSALTDEDRAYYEKEFGFFGEVTGISGKLKPFIKKSKAEKKRKIDEEMHKIRVQEGVYLPSNPDGTVVGIDYDSGRPLQSHAKAPFMATFIISRSTERDDEVQELLKESERTVTPVSNTLEGDSDEDEHVEEMIDEDALSVTKKMSAQLPVINESRPLSTQINIEVAKSPQQDQEQANAKSPSASVEPIDTAYLSSKLAQTKIEAHRTTSSAISDAPDLIGITASYAQLPKISLHVSNERAVTATSQTPAAQNEIQKPQLPQQQQQQLQRGRTESKMQLGKSTKSPEKSQVISRLSAIFKVGDDCRQDVLALQLIAVFKNIFASCGLDLYLYPYRVVATAPGCGVIDVIPNSISRDQMGREKVNSLSDYFATRYGGVDSIQYQQARTNFVQSLAAYSVLSYLLQFKDRHNGNIMLDDQGHIVHIDFGFILDIAPGGITFESAPFKLTAEYIQVMGGSEDAQPYGLFCELCVKAYLASRPYADKIIEIVALMLESGLPCFKGETTLTKLRARFQLEKTERDAAQFMVERIRDSYENKRTVLYDQFQKATNGIPY